MIAWLWRLQLLLRAQHRAIVAGDAQALARAITALSRHRTLRP